jgi:hypothetical protein
VRTRRTRSNPRNTLKTPSGDFRNHDILVRAAFRVGATSGSATSCARGHMGPPRNPSRGAIHHGLRRFADLCASHRGLWLSGTARHLGNRQLLVPLGRVAADASTSLCARSRRGA